MPQIILEHSANLSLDAEVTHTFFGAVHQELTQITQLASCKSRIIKASQYHIGDNNPANAFLFLKIALLPSPERTETTKQALGNTLFALLNNTFAPIIASQNLSCHPTLELAELQTYFK